MLFFVYSPVLIASVPLLVVGLIFATVTGGFLVVLTGVYYVAMGMLTLAGQAGRARRRAHRAEREPSASSVATRPTYRPTPRRRETVAATPAAVATRSARLASAGNLLVSGTTSDSLEQRTLIDVDRSPSPQPGRRIP